MNECEEHVTCDVCGSECCAEPSNDDHCDDGTPKAADDCAAGQVHCRSCWRDCKECFTEAARDHWEDLKLMERLGK